jgi:hypothetical protein
MIKKQSRERDDTYMKSSYGRREKNGGDFVVTQTTWWKCQWMTMISHTHFHLLTPWCRILFEKLIVTQLVKKYPFSWNPKVHHRPHKSPPLDPILSQPNPVHPIDPYLPKVHFNVILPPMPTSSQWSLAFRPPNQNPVSTSPLPHACHMPSPS